MVWHADGAKYEGMFKDNKLQCAVDVLNGERVTRGKNDVDARNKRARH